MRESPLAYPSKPLRAYGSAAVSAAAEMLWPTRCAVCGEAGELICDGCRRELPFIDAWRACSKCGSPYGRVQCTECNPVALSSSGRARMPFESLASAVVLTRKTRLIATTYKDAGERRLAAEMAEIMAAYVAPEEAAEAQGVAFIPATAAARRRRGFDHGELLAEKVACILGLPTMAILERPRALDQRGLSRRERAANMAHTMTVLPGASAPRSLLLVDDVCTTGATLAAACDALMAAGTERIRCLTFARA